MNKEEVEDATERGPCMGTVLESPSSKACEEQRVLAHQEATGSENLRQVCHFFSLVSFLSSPPLSLLVIHYSLSFTTYHQNIQTQMPQPIQKTGRGDKIAGRPAVG